MNPSENPNSTPPKLPNAAVETSLAAIPARRRLLRAGLMGAPALLALKSTPVLACNCKLPSGFSASGNVSRMGAGGKNCAAPCAKPSGWKGSTYTNSTKGTCYRQATTIKPTSYFKDCGFTGGKSGKFQNIDSCDTVLSRGDKDISALICAAYLEACNSGGSQFPGPAIIQNMWNQGVCGAGYTVTTGVVWKEAQVLQYLLYATNQA